MHRMSRWERRREEDSSDDCNVVPFDQYSIKFSSLLHMSYQIHITFFSLDTCFLALRIHELSWKKLTFWFVCCIYVHIYIFLWWILNTECLYFLEFMKLSFFGYCQICADKKLDFFFSFCSKLYEIILWRNSG